MSTHSQLSPSSRHRWAACPGSVREVAKYPERKSGPAAIEGTHTHTVLNQLLTNLTNVEVKVGEELEDHEGTFIVGEEQLERAMFAAAYVNRRCSELGYDAVLHSEFRVNPESLVGNPNMSGTADVVLYKPGDFLEVIDYKDGMDVVYAKNNPQLEQYAVGVVAELIQKNQPVPKRIQMTIIQPKLRALGMSGIDSWELPYSELTDIKDKMIVEWMATEAPDAPLIAGEKQCKYCAHKGNCNALVTQSLTASGIVFENLDIAKQSAEINPPLLPDDKLVEIMEAAPLVRQMIEAVEEEARRRLDAGKVIPGLKLVNGRGSRSWNVDEEEIAKKLKKMGVPKDKIFETKLISPAKVEKLKWVKGEQNVKLTDRQMKLISEYVTTVVGKPSVALESDHRKEVVPVQTLFSPVETVSLPEWLS